MFALTGGHVPAAPFVTSDISLAAPPEEPMPRTTGLGGAGTLLATRPKAPAEKYFSPNSVRDAVELK